VFLAFLLYGERPTRRKIGVALICLLGCAVLSFEPNGERRFSPGGIFLILLAAIGIALYTVYSQRLLKNYSPLAISAWTLPPVGIVFALLDWNNLPRYTEIPIAAWVVMLGAAVVGTYVALLLYFGAVVRIGATRTALICTIEPVSTALQATWILGERMTSWQILGAALILGGLVALEWPVKTREVNRKTENVRAEEDDELPLKEFHQRMDCVRRIKTSGFKEKLFMIGRTK
ncbi:MAG: DMT family transporter, partial [bacterium]